MGNGVVMVGISIIQRETNTQINVRSTPYKYEQRFVEYMHGFRSIPPSVSGGIALNKSANSIVGAPDQSHFPPLGTLIFLNPKPGLYIPQPVAFFRCHFLLFPECSLSLPFV